MSPSSAARRRCAGALFVSCGALAGCVGQDGTIAIELVTAPDSAVMDDVTRVRMVLSNPFTVVDAERGPDGSFDLTLDVIAEGPNGEILFQGFDADDTLIAYGRSPGLPIAAIDASIAIYVGAPRTLAEAPVTLGVARTEIGSVGLEYGVLLAGGRDRDGAPTSDLTIYNVYDHDLQRGEDLPEARAGAIVGAGLTGYAYVFGGEDADGDPRGNLWRFDTTVAPDGAWLEIDDTPELARAGASIAPLGSDAFLVTGTPPVLLEGLILRATAFETPAELGGLATSVQRLDEPGAPIYTLLVGDGAGPTGIVRLASGSFDEEPGPLDAQRTGHTVLPTVDDQVLVVGGADASGPLRSAIRCDPATRTYTPIPDLLAIPRIDAAIAATASYLLVAGGRDAAGDLLADAELFDLATLEPLGTIPMVVPRVGAIARPLPNQQILIVGGVDASGEPVELIELFTPDPPDLD